MQGLKVCFIPLNLFPLFSFLLFLLFPKFRDGGGRLQKKEKQGGKENVELAEGKWGRKRGVGGEDLGSGEE